jgi:hypothetical protein
MPEGAGERSLFDLMDYRLTPEQFEHALAQMKSYRTGGTDYLAYALLTTLMALRLTWPVAWMSRHQAALRAVLRLE